MLRISIATAFAAVLSLVATGPASAAPSARVDTGSRVAAPALLKDVHWEYRHHHRVWMPDHHRPYRPH